VAVVDATFPALGQWVDTLVRVSDLLAPSATMRLLVRVSDDQPGHLVEGGIDAFEVLADPFASVGDGPGAGTLHCWPNPSTGALHLMADPGEDLRALDLQGRLVVPVQRLQGGLNVMDLRLAAGTYVLVVDGNAGRRTVRWVVE
jgi:hypothetical protein